MRGLNPDEKFKNISSGQTKCRPTRTQRRRHLMSTHTVETPGADCRPPAESRKTLSPKTCWKSLRPQNHTTAVSSCSTSNASARPAPLASCWPIMIVDVSGGRDLRGRVFLHCHGTLDMCPCFTLVMFFHSLCEPICGRVCHQTSSTAIIIHGTALVFVFVRLMVSVLLFWSIFTSAL